MDFEFDSTTSGVFIALLVSVVSAVLYYMFKHASFVSRGSPSGLTSASVLSKRKKGKKIDSKKHKQARKHQRDDGGCVDDADDDSEVEEPNVEIAEEHSTPSTPLVNPDVDHEGIALSTDNAPETEQSNVSYRPHQPTDSTDSRPLPTGGISISELPKELIVPDAKLSPKETIKNSHMVHNLSNSEESDSRICKEEPRLEVQHQASSTEQLVPSKKRKRRALKHPGVSSATESMVTVTPAQAETNGSIQFLTSESQSETQNNDQRTIKSLRTEVNRLITQLKGAEHQLDEKSKCVSMQAESNADLRKKEEETSLGLRVLREQYTELLRTNKGLEHEKAMTFAKLKHLQVENDQLSIRLENFEEHANQYEQRIKQLLDQLKENESKLASALANAVPPDPLPEIVQAREIAQENLRLTTCLEQKDNSLTQLHQANAMHQEEIQALHESIAEKNTRLKELLLQLQVEQTEFNSRIAASEAELQRCCQEYECEKQDMARQMAKALNEVAVYREQEKRHMDTINSLQYQFSELNAHQRRLIGQVSSEKAANDTRIGGLQAELANTQSQLLRVTGELTGAEQRVAALRSQLEAEARERQAIASRWSPVQTCEVAIATDDQQQPCADRSVAASASSVPEQPVDTALLARLASATVELGAAQLALEAATAELAEARAKQEATDKQLEHYKYTLVQTEDTLAGLQAVAETSEAKWQRLFTDSQQAEARLRDQLTAAVTNANQSMTEVKCLEHRLAEERMTVERFQLEVEQLKSGHRSKQNDSHELRGEDKKEEPGQKQQTGLPPGSPKGGDAPVVVAGEVQPAHGSPDLLLPDRPSPAATPQDTDLASDTGSDEVIVEHTGTWATSW